MLSVSDSVDAAIVRTAWQELWQYTTPEIAQRLLGALLVHATADGLLVGRIVETEAYSSDDPACHGVRTLADGSTVHRCTPRNTAMFGPPGRAYVYFTYGAHYLLNVVTQPAGQPEAVLIRAVEPLEGISNMCTRRGTAVVTQLTNGPGKLTQAFGITGTYNGHDLSQPPLRILPGDSLPVAEIAVATRIGISRATTRPWRFYVRQSPWISKR